MKKKYRLTGLDFLNEYFYDELWKLRSELSLIAAIYEFSEIDKIMHQQISPRDKIESTPVVLRLNGPRKPSKKTFTKKDLYYDIGEAYLTMVKPLEEWADGIKNKLDKLSIINKEPDLKGKIEQYKRAYTARDYMTVFVQALSKRGKTEY